MSAERPCFRFGARTDCAVDQRSSFQAKSGSGSLLSTSESDGWGGRSQLPWNTSSLSVGQQKGPVQSRPNDRNAPAIAEAADPTSYFTLPRTSGIGTSAGSSSRKAFLTSGPEGISPSGDNLSGFSGFKSGETRRHGNPSAFGGTSMGSGFPIKGPFPGALDTPRSSELGESMPMSSLPQGAPDARQQPLSRGPYAHMSHNSASFTPQRPVHSATPSFHSESQGFDGRYGNTPMDVNAGLNKLQLNDGGFSGQLHRPPYLPHTSYDPSFQRVKYPTAGDNRSVAGYGSEDTTDLHLAYQAGKNQVGECDPIAPEYTRLGSPFYPLENPSPIAPHYRNGSGGRLSDGQAVALERKLRGLQQEQDYTQYSANPLQGAQYPPAYDFAEYQAARLNALSGFYPMAQLGGLGATAMVSRAHRDHDPTQIVRSPLLEEFRANSKGNKRYELKVW
jgi:mRNA-binding protein PUF3